MAQSILGYRLNGKTFSMFVSDNSDFDLLGADLVEMIFHMSHKDNAWGDLKNRLSGITIVKNSDKVHKEDIEKYGDFYQPNMNNRDKIDWTTLLWKLQSVEVFNQVLLGNVSHFVDSTEFGFDWKHCEYGYIINLDEMSFDVYYGLHDEYGSYPFDKKEDRPSKGIRLVKKFSMADIPNTWIEICDEIIGKW